MHHTVQYALIHNGIQFKRFLAYQCMLKVLEDNKKKEAQRKKEQNKAEKAVKKKSTIAEYNAALKLVDKLKNKGIKRVLRIDQLGDECCVGCLRPRGLLEVGWIE